MKWWFFHLRTNKQQLWIDEADLPSDAPRQMTAAASEHTALKWWTYLSAVMTGLTKWRLPQLLLFNLYSGEGFLTLQNNKSNRWSHQHCLLLQILSKAVLLFKCWISERVKCVVLNVSIAVCSSIVCVLNILSLKHCAPPPPPPLQAGTSWSQCPAVFLLLFTLNIKLCDGVRERLSWPCRAF